MDSDTEDDYGRLGDIKRNLREVANSRPGTNVAKAIIAYEETPSLGTLVLLLEEVSKNTDFSTDLRISLSYYIEEFLRLIASPLLSCHMIFVTTGKVLQYCSKIYADRVELVYQAVEQQIEALLIAEPKKAEKSDNGSNGEAKAPEKREKRRTKKLIQAKFNPFTFVMKKKNPIAASADHRFNHDDFDALVNVNHTIEYMYQDHTPAKLWENEPMIDPDNPNEQDEKKNYKLYTYHPEHRYNTLLQDIPFERLNMIKEYVNTNQLDVTEILNESMTNKEYLYKYIALENKMLASRFDCKTGEKRSLDASEDVQPKRLRLEEGEESMELEAECSSKRMLEDAEESPCKRRHTDDGDIKTELINTKEISTQLSGDSVLNDPFQSLALADTGDVTLNGSNVGEPNLCSTLVNNESSLNLPAVTNGKSIDLQFDSGLGVDDVTDKLLPTAAAFINKCCAAQSFDDEGVVLPDNMDELRMMSLSPKVMVRDIFPGVPDKANLSIRVDSEILALCGIHEPLEEAINISRLKEEIVNAPREVRYTIEHNLLGIPLKKLRRNCLFKLPKEFDLFKETRLPAKRVGERRNPATSRTIAKATESTEDRVELEFDMDQNFLGFRRTTFDSGIEYEDIRADENVIVDVVTEVAEVPTSSTEEIQEIRASNPTEDPVTLPEKLGATLDTTIANQSDTNDAQLSLEDDLIVLESQVDDQVDSIDVDLTAPILSTSVLEETPSDESYIVSKNATNIDEETNARIVDWHRRLAPALEAAHERQNFSIQELNDEVIKKCQEKNGEATLADVLEDKDPTRLCCYMLSSLLLTNQGNVKLQIDTLDKSKPIEMNQFKMKLLSTERKQLNPEDDIGNRRSVGKPGTSKATQPDLNAKRSKACDQQVHDSVPTVNVQTVRLIKAVPKALPRADDADSGISSLPASLVSSQSIDT